MFFIILYIIFLCIYCVLPVPLQITTFCINMFIPDPIPVLDEAFMVITTLKKLNSLAKIIDVVDTIIGFFKSYWKSILIIGVLCFVFFKILL